LVTDGREPAVPGELLKVLEAAAASIADVRSTSVGATRTWSRGEHPFAVQDGPVAELRLGSTIAAAALRTPDVSASARGPDWVAFAPPELDGHALDRLGAWFAAAHRRAGA
jgi:hypothetical protein